MDELLDLTRREYEAAYWYMDEESSRVVNVGKDVRISAFQEFMKLHGFIQQTQMDLRARYIAIGVALLQIKRDKLYYYVAPKYKGGCGYSSFKKFCQEVFGLSGTTAQRLVRVAEEFCGMDGGIRVEYVNFSYSQLSEMLSIDEKYRPRITTSCSTRDIRRLSELYKDYVPAPDTSVEADLTRWREIHAEEQARKNAKKNSLCFIPALPSDAAKGAGPAPDQDENVPDPDEFDGEDYRDLSTPNVEKQHISFEAIRNGLLRQLQLLRDCDVGVVWKKCADIFEDALNSNAPRKVASSKEIVDVKVELAALKEELSALKAQPSAIVREGMALPPAQKLTLKNAKERKEWVEGYESWPVWLDVPEVAKTFYRYDFINGAALIIEVGADFWLDWQKSTRTRIRKRYVHYAIIDEEYPEYDSAYQGGMSAIVDWLTKHSKEI